jgi:hypothetical protein
MISEEQQRLVLEMKTGTPAGKFPRPGKYFRRE